MSKRFVIATSLCEQECCNQVYFFLILNIYDLVQKYDFYIYLSIMIITIQTADFNKEPIANLLIENA